MRTSPILVCIPSEAKYPNGFSNENRKNLTKRKPQLFSICFTVSVDAIILLLMLRWQRRKKFSRATRVTCMQAAVSVGEVSRLMIGNMSFGNLEQWKLGCFG